MKLHHPLAAVLALLLPALAAAQGTPSIPSEPGPGDALPRKTVVVPVPMPPAEQPQPYVAPAQPVQPQPIVAPLPREPAVEVAPAPAPTPAPAPAPDPVQYAAPAPPPSLEPDPATAAAETKPTSGAILDGHLREGAFLSGPGSMQFVLHHTLLGTLGGLATQLSWSGSNLDPKQRETLLYGALIGAGLGFGFSAWWQFNHWIDTPAATFGLVDSVIGGMFFAGLMNLMSQDPTIITWSAVIGSELAAWLTTVIGGGDMALNQGVLIMSGGAWALAYAGLLLAIIRTSGTSTGSTQAVADTLLIAPGIGAGVLALMSMRYKPTTAQVLRADVFGAGVGLAVLLLSSLVIDPRHNSSPYVLSLLGSAGAITAVSLLWEEAAERPSGIYVDPEKRRPYRTVWW
ncbi:MAG: hypothetical protein ACYC8T_07105 [Myxococcaceae bacterium]